MARRKSRRDNNEVEMTGGKYASALYMDSNQAKQKFSFIKRVDKGWITTVKDLESWRFER